MKMTKAKAKKMGGAVQVRICAPVRAGPERGRPGGIKRQQGDAERTRGPRGQMTTQGTEVHGTRHSVT